MTVVMTPSDAPVPLWREPHQLVALGSFFDQEEAGGVSVTDEEFLQSVRDAYWPANLSNFVQTAFAVTAHACALRPHLVSELLKAPLDAVRVDGAESPEAFLASARFALGNPEPYIPFTPRGRQWLSENLDVVRAAVAPAFETSFA